MILLINLLILKFLEDIKNAKEYSHFPKADQQRLDEIIQFVGTGKDVTSLFQEVQSNNKQLAQLTLDDLFSDETEDFEPIEGIMQLKITLNGAKPSIWRRILVDPNMTFDELHNVIQVSMGWTNSHLYNFNYKNIYIEPENDEFDFGSPFGKETLDAEITIIGDLLSYEGESCIYTYDFGDNWEHTIKVEKIISDETSENDEFFVPRCIKAKRACPPEDCGGIPGLAELEKVLAGPKTEEQDSLKIWVGESYDSEKVDLDDINQNLQKLYKELFL